MTPSSQPRGSALAPSARQPLADCLSALAGTPDDSSWISAQLSAVASLSAGLLGPVRYATVTAYRDDSFTTVAASDHAAAAIDEAQYADQAGPCLDAIETGSPVAEPDIAITAGRPGHHSAAARLGIRAALSIPLFAGRGTAIAALNLYGEDPTTMAALTAAVLATYDPCRVVADDQLDLLDDAGRSLVAGLGAAFRVRAHIQQAIGVVAAGTQRTADVAYLILRLRAAEIGATLPETAAAVLDESRW